MLNNMKNTIYRDKVSHKCLMKSNSVTALVGKSLSQINKNRFLVVFFPLYCCTPPLSFELPIQKFDRRIPRPDRSSQLSRSNFHLLRRPSRRRFTRRLPLMAESHEWCLVYSCDPAKAASHRQKRLRAARLD